MSLVGGVFCVFFRPPYPSGRWIGVMPKTATAYARVILWVDIPHSSPRVSAPSKLRDS